MIVIDQCKAGGKYAIKKKKKGKKPTFSIQKMQLKVSPNTIKIILKTEVIT